MTEEEGRGKRNAITRWMYSLEDEHEEDCSDNDAKYSRCGMKLYEK